MSQVLVRDVRKAYGSVEVIHGVNVDIADGEFVVLVGPSGCGKSTLLRMIAGLESITGGKISDRRSGRQQRAATERDIAMVFQTYALYPHMKVADNMAFSLKLKKTDPAEVEERVKSAATILGLTPYLDRYPRQLSGGQRQRVAMGRAIVRNPQVFLFDEPLSNLDAKLRVQMRTEIKELHQRLKTTTVYVTHDQVEAMTMADRIVVLQDGNVEQIGAPLDLYDNPANLFVASFIGSPSMNLIKGKAKNIDGEVCRRGRRRPSGRWQRPHSHRRPGGDLRHQAGTSGTLPMTDLKAKVGVIEPTGSETMVFTHAGGNDLLALFRERHMFAPGQAIRLKPPQGCRPSVRYRHRQTGLT